MEQWHWSPLHWLEMVLTAAQQQGLGLGTSWVAMLSSLPSLSPEAGVGAGPGPGCGAGHGLSETRYRPRCGEVVVWWWYADQNRHLSPASVPACASVPSAQWPAPGPHFTPHWPRLVAWSGLVTPPPAPVVLICPACCLLLYLLLVLARQLPQT